MGLDVFSEHRIAETIRKDLANTLSSPQMNNFINGLGYKSQKTREADEALVDLLTGKLTLYAKAWIQCNANKTTELWNKSSALDEQISGLTDDLSELNITLNKIIVLLKDNLSSEQIETLRSIERLIIKLNK